MQGRCIVRNSVESKLARSIAIDYFSGYLVNEYGRQALFELPAYGGANCAVRASTLRRLGGWNTESVTEDTDLTLRVVMLGDRVRYDITAVDTEEGATTLRRFMSQRYRWARGHQQVWRDYRGYVLRTRHLSVLEKIETMMFLLVYHVPVLCTMTLLMTVLRIAGIGPTLTIFELLPLAALLFAGPFCELAVGLMVGRAPRRSAWSIAWMTPIFFVFMLVCTKAWVDGLLGRQYAWVKTARSSWSALEGAEDDLAPVGSRTPGKRDGMNRRRFVVFSALAMALIVAVGGFDLLNGPARQARGLARHGHPAAGRQPGIGGQRHLLPAAATRADRLPGPADARTARR